MVSFTEAGAKYLELGFRVLPVNGKEGFVKGGWKVAASTRAEVELYWKSYPTANLALVLPPDRCVLDIDPRNGATEAPAAYPATPVSKTGGGGYHLYFKRDPARKLKHTLGPGLDIIGEKGQAVEWPSKTAAAYGWFKGRAPGQIPYADAPEAFYEPPEAPRKPNGHATPDDRARKYCAVAFANQKYELSRAPKGGRNAALNNAALSLGHLAHFGTFTEDEAKLALRGACYDNGLIGDDGIDSFDMTFASGWEAGLAEPHELPEGSPRPNGHAQAAPASQPAGEVFSAVSLAAKEFPELEWVVEGILPIGLAMLCGKPKLGKSWMAFAISIAVASGAIALGKAKAAQCEVLHLPLEDPGRRLQFRMLKLLKGEAVPEGLFFADAWPRLNQGGIDKIGQFLDEHPACRFVVIDTWGKIRETKDKNASANIYQSEYDEVGVLHKFAHDRNICLLLIHHTSKREADDVFDQISGTTGIPGAADTLLILHRKRGERAGVLSLTGRDIVEDGDFALTWDQDTGHWTIAGKADDVRQDTQKASVLNYVLAQEDGATVAEMASELRLSQNTVRGTLRRLKKAGTLVNPTKGFWKRP